MKNKTTSEKIHICLFNTIIDLSCVFLNILGALEGSLLSVLLIKFQYDISTLLIIAKKFDAWLRFPSFLEFFVMKDDDLIPLSRSQTYDIPIITSDAVPLSLL